MQGAGEPQTEGRENLAVVLGHRCDNPASGQQAIEQERPKHDVAQRARDGRSVGILSRGRWHWRNDIPRGSFGHSPGTRVGLGGRLLDGHKLAVSYRELMRRKNGPLITKMRSASRMAMAPAYE